MLIPDMQSLFFLMSLFSLTQAKSKLCHRKEGFKLIQTELGKNPTTTICLRATKNNPLQPVVRYDNSNYTQNSNSSGFYFTVDNSTASRDLYRLYFKNISVQDYKLHRVVIYNIGQVPVMVDVFIQPTDYDGDWTEFLTVYLYTGGCLLFVLFMACIINEKVLCCHPKVTNWVRQIFVKDKKLQYTQVQTKNTRHDTSPLRTI
ncbi:uncharacterized protein LOC131941478 [Physella acuta]|uniref:uncharacterized protein LOC131941478 n=1 Tax=Physella acuta TaxID=109671 RepID=UPI0027DC426F|nr:uncharacterized protein LOC131941478 [Physella acuta]